MQRCKAKNYAIKDEKVCRMHGAGGGPKTQQGLQKCKKAPFKYGHFSEEGLEELRLLRKLAKADYLSETRSTTSSSISSVSAVNLEEICNE